MPGAVTVAGAVVVAGDVLRIEPTGVTGVGVVCRLVGTTGEVVTGVAASGALLKG